MKIILFAIYSFVTITGGCKFRAWNLHERFKIMQGMEEENPPEEHDHKYRQPRYDYISWPPGFPKHPPTNWDRIDQHTIDCSNDVDACFKTAIRTGGIGGFYSDASQQANAKCANRFNCQPARQRLCRSFRFEDKIKPWMYKQCEQWGLLIPTQQILHNYG